MSTVALPGTAPRQRVHWTERLAHAALALVALALLAFLAAPLLTLLQKAVEDGDARFVGLANFIAYAKTPALLQSVWNSLWVSLLVTAYTVPTAFLFAYAPFRTR
jgi:iron(III) transport system permease protein